MRYFGPCVILLSFVSCPVSSYGAEDIDPGGGNRVCTAENDDEVEFESICCNSGKVRECVDEDGNQIDCSPMDPDEDMLALAVLCSSAVTYIEPFDLTSSQASGWICEGGPGAGGGPAVQCLESGGEFVPCTALAKTGCGVAVPAIGGAGLALTFGVLSVIGALQIARSRRHGGPKPL